MASHGPRAAGSDGSDFRHREQVASRYQTSAALKSKLKLLAYINLATCLPHAVYILNSHLKLFNIPGGSDPAMCHYVLLLTVASSLLYLIAMLRNRAVLVHLANAITLLCGVGGAAYGFFAYFHLMTSALVDKMEDAVMKTLMIIFCTWYVIFITDIFMYVMAVYIAWRLVETWNLGKTKAR